MNAAVGQAEKLLATMNVAAEGFRVTDSIAKVQGLTVPEQFTAADVKAMFLVPLQDAIREDERIAHDAAARIERLEAENEELKKEVSKLKYRINHVFKSNVITPKPHE